MRKLMITLVAAIALTLTACAAGPKHTANDAKAAIAAAEHETNRAAKRQFEWRDTRKIIKKAKKALKAGDYDKAVKLAGKAKAQSTMAIKQSMQPVNTGHM